MRPAMPDLQRIAPDAPRPSLHSLGWLAAPLAPRLEWARAGLGTGLAAIATMAAAAGFGSSVAGLAVAIGAAGWVAFRGRRRQTARSQALQDLLLALRRGEPFESDPSRLGDLAPLVEPYQAVWRALPESHRRARALAQRIVALCQDMERGFGSLERSTLGQEEAVEETASLVAHMRTSMSSIGEQVDQLLRASDESASSVLQMSSSIEEVAGNTATLHEVVEASTSSVHEMGASIRQVAEGAEQVQEMAEGTASSVTQMDRSIQEVSSHAHEAAVLTQTAYSGAESGTDAVRATISDIEQISALTSQAKERLTGLVARVSKIGNILSAIDEINDETNLLSLNAAIIAAQAGEQGKAFLVVANHVKTLARRTASSTQDIERLIADIEGESGGAVQAMETGIEAVQKGVARSRTAGDALLAIQEACRDASERVNEIARATAEQSRNSKGVAESTRRTSLAIQQISEAMNEQRRASEEMLTNAERALETCRHVHRSTDEQRSTSRFITQAISDIRDMIRVIGEQTTVHGRASEDVSAAVMALLENAQQAGATVKPMRSLITELRSQATAMDETEASLASAPLDPADGASPQASSPDSGPASPPQEPDRLERPYGPTIAAAESAEASAASATASPAR